jgi:hypothetical protein
MGLKERKKPVEPNEPMELKEPMGLKSRKKPMGLR